MSQRPELDLLIACALPAGCRETGSRVRAALGVPLDWNRVRELGAYHRVRPLLYERLTKYAADAVPANVAAELASEFRSGVARSLYLTGELVRLTKAFAAVNIPVLPHKGPVLAQTAYGDLALREFSDLDLLIHSSDLPAAIKLLEECGFLPPPDLAWLSPQALLRWTWETSYTSASGVSVDLHWRLTPPHYTVQLDPDILWNHRASITIAGSALPSITPEAMLLLLAVHGGKHCWEALGWLADIAWLLDANPKLDWQLAWKLAGDTKCHRPLLLALSLVAQLFDANVPKLGSDPLAGKLRQRVMARLYQGPIETPRSPELFSFAATLARQRSDSLKHLLGVVFHPTEIDWKERRLPDSRFWLYTPARLARLCGKYLRRKTSSSERT